MMDLVELGTVQPDSHWYYQSKFTFLRRTLQKLVATPTQVVDVGAGSGFFAKKFAEHFRTSRIIAYDPNYTQDFLEQHDDSLYQNHLTSMDIANADVVLMIDVLEHISDPKSVLLDFTRQAKKDALFLITVPAFMILWSQHDVFLKHYRRYRIRDVQLLVKNSGLDVISSRYLYSTIFPIALLKRRLTSGVGSDMRELPRRVNSLLRLLCVTEHALPWLRLPGLTAFVVARKSSG